MKVLIVDDDTDARILLSHYVLRLGATPLSCTDGVEAVELYRREQPDVVFMDIAMPGMDGLQAIEHIRSIDREACVFVFTAYSDDMLRRAARAAGAVGYFLKDGIDPLLNLLRRRIERKSATQNPG